MEYLIIAFRSRTKSAKLSYILKSQNYANTVISTPKELGLGCGLSVKTPFVYYREIVNRLKTSRFSEYYLFYLSENNGKTFIKRLQ